MIRNSLKHALVFLAVVAGISLCACGSKAETTSVPVSSAAISETLAESSQAAETTQNSEAAKGEDSADSADITAKPTIDPELNISGLDVTVTKLKLGKVEKKPDDVRVDVYYDSSDVYAAAAKGASLKINDVEYDIQGVGAPNEEKFFVWVLENDLRSNGINNVTDIKKIETRVNPVDANGEREDEIIDVTVTAKWGQEDAAPVDEAEAVEADESSEASSDTAENVANTGVASAKTDFSKLVISIGNESFELPVSKTEFTKGNISLDEDIYKNGRLYRMGYKGTTYRELLVDCQDDMVTGIRSGLLTIYNARKEAAVFKNGDSSAVPEITVCGLKLGDKLSDDQVKEFESIAQDVIESHMTLDDDTEYEKNIVIFVEDDKSISTVQIFLSGDNQIVGFVPEKVVF